MPYKKRQDYNKFMRQYMREWRKQQAQAMKRLQNEYPKVFTEVFGKPKRRRKQ